MDVTPDGTKGIYMNKNDFLNDPEVASFITWMAAQLAQTSTLGHHYLLPHRRRVEFNNLADALAKYDWKAGALDKAAKLPAARSYEENRIVLSGLRQKLRAAVAAQNEIDADIAARDASIGVVRWGGVSNGNERWLNENTAGLATLLARTATILEQEDEAVVPSKLRFNAGMTKVYSLLLDHFIIYDSRVAAALAWFVMKWSLDKTHVTIPEALAFACLSPKEGKAPKTRKVRNPGTGNRQFPTMSNAPQLHARWNMRANWLLAAVLAEAADTPFHRDAEPLRALEAALFMWGYDLGHNAPWLIAPLSAAA